MLREPPSGDPMTGDEQLIRAGAALEDRFGRQRADAFAAALPRLVENLVER